MPRLGVFVHEVRVVLDPGGEPAALAAAVTEALCGSADHEPPCHWPHHTALIDAGGVTVARTVCRARRKDAEEVRRLIDVRVAEGRFTGPDRRTATWQHMHSLEPEPTADEVSLGRGFPAAVG